VQSAFDLRAFMLAKLIPVGGGDPISITRGVTVVGRSQSLCDVVIDQVSISKLQCVIAKTDGLLFIRDLGSTNGTKVNGQRITRGALLPGDELSFASIRFQVHLGPGASVAEDDDVIGDNEQTAVLNGLPQPPEEDYADDREEVGSSSDVRLLSDDSAIS
jgi:pSer/pThr/pTyr-binding forkhead associated (FHA) protein